MARAIPNFVYFAIYFDDYTFLNVLKDVNFGPWTCQKKFELDMRFELCTLGPGTMPSLIWLIRRSFRHKQPFCHLTLNLKNVDMAIFDLIA